MAVWLRSSGPTAFRTSSEGDRGRHPQLTWLDRADVAIFDAFGRLAGQA